LRWKGTIGGIIETVGDSQKHNVDAMEVKIDRISVRN